MTISGLRLTKRFTLVSSWHRRGGENPRRLRSPKSRRRTASHAERKADRNSDLWRTRVPCNTGTKSGGRRRVEIHGRAVLLPPRPRRHCEYSSQTAHVEC